MTDKATAFADSFAEKEQRRAERLSKAKQVIGTFALSPRAKNITFSLEDGHFLRMQETTTFKCTAEELYNVMDGAGLKKQTGSFSVSQNPDGTFTVVKVRFFKL